MTWGAVASVAVSAISGNQQKQAGIKAADRQAEAARLAAEGSEFNPYEVSGAFGSGQFDKGGQPILDAAGNPVLDAQGNPTFTNASAGVALTPEMQAIQDQFGAQAGQFAGQGQTALGQQAGALGGQFLGAINADPYAAAQSQFNQMDSILNTGRQRQREALEGRLLKQGRLGSSGGALQQEGLESAIEQSRQKGLYDSLQQSQAMQMQQANMGQTLGMFGQQQQDVGFNQAQARLGAMQGIDQAGLNYLNMGGAFGGRQASAGAQAGQFNMQGASAGTAAQLGAAAGQASAFGKIGSAIGGYFNQPSGGSYYNQTAPSTVVDSGDAYAPAYRGY